MSKPYTNDAQIFTFGVHGTNNDPSNVREVARRISAAVGRTTDGANLFDNGFSWNPPSAFPPYPAGSSHTGNQVTDRQIASERLTNHVLGQVDRALDAGTLDRSKPLTINLVGFSHGGNVALLASDNIAAGLRERGLDSAIHMTTLSTPAYTHGAESPATAASGVRRQGVQFDHTHFSVIGDGVIRGAIGNSEYGSPTRDIILPRVSHIDGIANHGAPQDRDGHMNTIAQRMQYRFGGLGRQATLSDAGGDTFVAGVNPTAPVAVSSVNSWDAMNNNATSQQVSAALYRAVPAVAQEHQNPSLIAGLTEAAATNKMSAVHDVGFSPDQQTAFLSDRDKSDPAAKIVPVNMDVASKPFDDAWQKAVVAIETNQRHPIVAQNHTLELDQIQKQNTRSVA